MTDVIYQSPLSPERNIDVENQKSLAQWRRLFEGPEGIKNESIKILGEKIHSSFFSFFTKTEKRPVIKPDNGEPDIHQAFHRETHLPSVATAAIELNKKNWEADDPLKFSRRLEQTNNWLKEKNKIDYYITRQDLPQIFALWGILHETGNIASRVNPESVSEENPLGFDYRDRFIEGEIKDSQGNPTGIFVEDEAIHMVDNLLSVVEGLDGEKKKAYTEMIKMLIDDTKFDLGGEKNSETQKYPNFWHGISELIDQAGQASFNVTGQDAIVGLLAENVANGDIAFDSAEQAANYFKFIENRKIQLMAADIQQLGITNPDEIQAYKAVFSAAWSEDFIEQEATEIIAQLIKEEHGLSEEKGHNHPEAREILKAAKVGDSPKLSKEKIARAFSSIIFQLRNPSGPSEDETQPSPPAPKKPKTAQV